MSGYWDLVDERTNERTDKGKIIEPKFFFGDPPTPPVLLELHHQLHQLLLRVFVNFKREDQMLSARTKNQKKLPHWEEYCVQISKDFINSLSLCAQMSAKCAQKQVFLLIFRVKIWRYGLGTKNKNVRHVEKNKISKNKKISPRGFWEIWKRAQKTGVFAP